MSIRPAHGQVLRQAHRVLAGRQKVLDRRLSKPVPTEGVGTVRGRLDGRGTTHGCEAHGR
ncbi:MAG: hypothetical protein QXT14_03025 [Candidatus Bathyarchaeia archaeon]